MYILHHWAGRLEQFDHLRDSSHLIIRQVTWNNQTTREILCILHHQAGHLEQLDHLRDPSHFIIWKVTWNNQASRKILRISSLSSGRSPRTIGPLARSLVFYHQAGLLEQLDNSQNSLHFFFTIEQVSWNNQTTHEISRILSSGRSLGTIRPLVKFFAFLLHHREGCLE